MKHLNQHLILILAFATVGMFLHQTSAIAQTAFIQDIKGKVELKRRTWSNFRPITRNGTPLTKEDQLRRAKDARAMVVCPSGKKRPIRRVEERTSLTEICTDLRVIISKGSPPLGSIGGINLQIPFLISPRRTLLLTSTPTLRWNPVPGANQYRVQILNAGKVVWQTQVKEPQVAYPGNPVLQSGIPYSVIIQTDTGKSSQEENVTGTEFIILQEAEVKAVQTEVNTMLKSDLTDEVKFLKLADYYANYVVPQPSDYGLSKEDAKGYRLSADAIVVLDSLIIKGTRSSLIYRTLGDLYWQTGLVKSAEKAYLSAIENVQSSEDLEAWALSMLGIGELYEATRDFQPALRWYSQARAGFITLDDRRAEVLDRRIARLKKTTVNLLRD